MDLLENIAPENLVNALTQAIMHHQLVGFVYRGTLRVVAPYILGISRQEHAVISAVQLSGESTSGPLPGWRNFDLSDIEELKLIAKLFRLRADYNAKDPNFKTIVARAQNNIAGPSVRR